MFVRDIFYHVLAYVVAGRHCIATPCAYENFLMFLFDFDQFGLKVIKFYLLACYIPMVWKFRFLPKRGGIEHVKEYPTMNYIRIHRHTPSIIVCKI